MGYSANYRKKIKSDQIEAAYYEPEAKKKKGRSKASGAWRKIEEREMFKQFCHDLEFFDDHLDGKFEDYI